MKKLLLLILPFIFLSTVHGAEYKACTDRTPKYGTVDSVNCGGVVTEINTFIPNDQIRIAIYSPQEMASKNILGVYCKNAPTLIREKLYLDKWILDSDVLINGWAGWLFSCVCPEWQLIANDYGCYPASQISYINNPNLRQYEEEQARKLSESMANAERIRQEQIAKSKEASEKERIALSEKERLQMLEQEKILALQNTQLALISIKEELARVKAEKQTVSTPIISIKEKNTLRIKALKEKRKLKK